MRKNFIILMCGMITIGMLGCGSTENTNSVNKEISQSTSVTEKKESSENILLDANKLGEYSIDDINKFINKEPEKINDYKFVYDPITEEEVFFDDIDGKIIYLSYDLKEEDKAKEYDKDKLFKKFGINIDGSDYSEINNMISFKNIKDFGSGEISVFKNSDGFIENITFYTKGINEFNSFLDRINK